VTDAPTTSEPVDGGEPVDGELVGEAGPELVYGCVVSTSFGQQVLHPTRDQYLGLAKALVDDGYHLCADVTAVDYLTHPGRALPPGIEPERFEVAVVVRNLEERSLLRIRVQVAADEPVLPSLFDLWPGTEALEREVFDMFGIRFDGHPDLTRILMPEDWVGHPLRKDEPVGQIPVQFTTTRGAPEVGT
jgi:NADH-quinone oxidoreductase subunit C